MAWSVDQASLGSNAIAATATSVPLTTTATVAAGALIVVGVSDDSASITTASDNGPNLSWSKGPEGANGLNVCMVYAVAPAGMASGTIITVNFASTSTNRLVTASSFACAGTVSAGTSGQTNGSTAAWASPSVTAGANDLTVGVATIWTGSGTLSSPVSPSIEDADVQSLNTAADKEIVIEHRTDAGSHTIAGTWGSTIAWVALVKLFTETAAVAAGAARPAALPVVYLRRNL